MQPTVNPVEQLLKKYRVCERCLFDTVCHLTPFVTNVVLPNIKFVCVIGKKIIGVNHLICPNFGRSLVIPQLTVVFTLLTQHRGTTGA